MIKTFSKYLLLLCFVQSATLALANSPAIATSSIETVLNHLYTTNGNFSKIHCPRIELTTDKKRVAAYYPRQHKIVVETAVLEVCQSFGSDSLSALAFILGHELTHAYQKHSHPTDDNTSYLGFHKSANSAIKIEQEADIHGLFNAYLAGYKAIDLLPDLMSRLYTAYDLVGVQQDGYPSLEERKASAYTVQKEVTTLIQLYDGATYLSAIGKQDLAAACYEYIAQFYQGKEVYNNIGVNFALDAINFSPKDVDLLLYPLELDWTARIKKPKTTRGTEILSRQELAYRNQQLQQALIHLEKVHAFDPNHFSTQLNLMCVWNLMGDYQRTINYQQNPAIINANPRAQKLAQLAIAIAHAKIGSANSLLKARQIWESLKKDSDPIIAYQSDYNLKMISYEKCEPIKNFQCVDLAKADDFIDAVRLHRMQYTQGFPLNNSVNIQLLEYPNSLVYVFQKGRQLFSLQRVYKNAAAKLGQLPQTKTTENPLQLVATDTGHFQICMDRKLILQGNQNGKIVEWGKWW